MKTVLKLRAELHRTHGALTTERVGLCHVKKSQPQTYRDTLSFAPCFICYSADFLLLLILTYFKGCFTWRGPNFCRSQLGKVVTRPSHADWISNSTGPHFVSQYLQGSPRCLYNLFLPFFPRSSTSSSHKAHLRSAATTIAILPPTSPGALPQSHLKVRERQLQIWVLWKTFTVIVCFWLMWTSCRATCSITTQPQPPRSSTQCCFVLKKELCFNSRYRKKRTTPALLLQAELPGWNNWRQVFSIWFPILSFFLPVKSVSQCPEQYIKWFFSMLTFLTESFLSRQIFCLKQRFSMRSQTLWVCLKQLWLLASGGFEYLKGGGEKLHLHEKL